MVGILAAFGVEVGLQMAGKGGLIIYSTDPDLLWVPAPNQRGRTVVGGLPETYNSAGLRYPIDVPRDEPDTVRVFTFGDSVTMGWGVDDHSHYSAVLERLLQQQPARTSYRVMSAGVNAYPTFLSVRRFRKLLNDNYRMDVAVLASSFNNNFENLETLDADSKRALLRNVRLKSLLRRSATYTTLIEGLLRTLVYYPLRQRLVRGSWDVDVESTQGLDRFVNALEQMKAESDRHGIKLILLLLGSQEQRADLNLHQQAMVDFAQSRGVALISMIDVQKTMDHRDLYLDYAHPSAKGHALIANALLKVIRADQPEFRRHHEPRDHSPAGTTD